jgi:CRISPR-associated exonuclease Cas4
MSITPSHILQYLYCPRFIYFEYVLCIPQYQEKYYKVEKGRDIHDQKTELNKDYLRKRIGVADKIITPYLTNSYLRGEVDEVLFLNNNTAAPLDYKFAAYNDTVYDTYKTQLVCYAILIESNFDQTVDKGYLVYVRSKNKLVEVVITQADKEAVINIVQAIVAIIEQNVFPKATTNKKRCSDCTYRNICIK